MRSKQKGQGWTTFVALGLSLTIAVLPACSGDKSAQRPATATPESTGAAGAQATASGAEAGTATATPSATNGGVRRRVVLLGTSLTAGLGLDPDKAYPSLLQRKADSAGFPVTIINAGLSGETSAGALRRAAWVLDQPAGAVILEVGANDGLRGVDPDSTYANIVALLAAVKRKQPNAKTLLVQMEAPTNLGRDYTTRFHAAYLRASKEAGVPLLPFLLDGVAGDPRLNQADGIHPNIEGSKIVAATMWTAMLPLFNELKGSQSASPTPPKAP